MISQMFRKSVASCNFSGRNRDCGLGKTKRNFMRSNTFYLVIKKHMKNQLRQMGDDRILTIYIAAGKIDSNPNINA